MILSFLVFFAYSFQGFRQCPFVRTMVKVESAFFENFENVRNRVLKGRKGQMYFRIQKLQHILAEASDR
ncbi:MAG TPA: hypothetical protein PKC40_09635 [Saprospiraceae bacterium]|nr:hypothetical protein [Saprospiraceae bacterium]